jgi:hypothetical protein
VATRGSKSERRKGGVAGRLGDAEQTGRACGEPIQAVGNPMLTFLCLWGSWSWGVEKLVVDVGGKSTGLRAGPEAVAGRGRRGDLFCMWAAIRPGNSWVGGAKAALATRGRGGDWCRETRPRTLLREHVGLFVAINIGVPGNPSDSEV